MFASSQLDFSAISASSLPTNLAKCNSKRRLQKMENVQEEKRHLKKRHLAAFVFVPSVFGEKFPTAEF
jgi:hypothetical protein